MRKTRKLNKKYRKTRRGGVRSTLRKMPPLPPSPPPTPPSSPLTNRPTIKVENKNLTKIEPHTYNWWVRHGRKIALQKEFNKNGFKANTVPVNSDGYPNKSFFKPNNTFPKHEF
jgi:hypothetical protein